MEGDGFGQDDGNPVADFHSVAGFGGMAVDLDPLLADQRLDARAGEVGKAGREKAVDAFARTVIDLNFHVGIVAGRNLAASFKFAGGSCRDTLRPCQRVRRRSLIVIPAGIRWMFPRWRHLPTPIARPVVHP